MRPGTSLPKVAFFSQREYNQGSLPRRAAVFGKQFGGENL
ncbi:hypothetical protein HMPREF1545_02353 [Oscillibacter sp. KLE 1728]|nr:hypothetical protein HMPREF1545_02353 [Oscillibacter sp. KLE 1728]